MPGLRAQHGGWSSGRRRQASPLTAISSATHVPDGRHNGAPYTEASHGCDNHMLFHQDLEGETDVAVSERMGEWRQQSLRSRPHEADRRTVQLAVDFFARMADTGAPGTGCEPSVAGCTWPAYVLGEL